MNFLRLAMSIMIFPIFGANAHADATQPVEVQQHAPEAAGASRATEPPMTGMPPRMLFEPSVGQTREDRTAMSRTMRRTTYRIMMPANTSKALQPKHGSVR